MFDMILTSTNATSALVQVNRTDNMLQQMAVNYIACSSTFFLDIRYQYFDLSATQVYTLSGPATTNIVVTYKLKSNSTNAVAVYSTAGISMVRQSNTY